MEVRAAVAEVLARLVDDRHLQRSRGPILRAAHLVELDLAVLEPAVEARTHRQQIAQPDARDRVIDVARMLLRERRNERLIWAAEIAARDPDPDQLRHDTLRD